MTICKVKEVSEVQPSPSVRRLLTVLPTVGGFFPVSSRDVLTLLILRICLAGRVSCP